MGHIKEPKGVDFIIKSVPLTTYERVAISDFIRQYKKNHSPKKTIRNLGASPSKKSTTV
jgi:hypothetical protein